YPMNKALNMEEIEVEYNAVLSDVDEAFIALSYLGSKNCPLAMDDALWLANVHNGDTQQIKTLITQG
ncbi:hypothetical protein AX17_007105, partial [Amanita inopinata Kibby_2008]